MTLEETKKRIIEATFLNLEKVKQESLRAEKENRIPKIVHFIFLGWRYMKKGYLERIRHWMEILPNDWIFVNWTPAIKEIETDFERWLFNNNKFAFYADLARCKQVYRYGGVYMDCDVELNKDLTPLLDYDYIFCKEIQQPYMDGGVFMAKKGNIFLKTISDRYDRTPIEEYKSNPRMFLLGDAWKRAILDAKMWIDYSSSHDFESYKKNLSYKSQKIVYCIDTKYFCNPIRYYQKIAHWYSPNPDSWTSHMFTNSWSF